jgi:hypothetical protein
MIYIDKEMIMKNNYAGKILLVLSLILSTFSSTFATIAVKMFSYEEAMSQTNISRPRLYIQNTGTEAISNFYYNYYFETEDGLVPVLEDYYTINENVTLVSDGASKYHIKYEVSGTVQPGQILPLNGGNVIGLHYNSWGYWDKNNDFSNNKSTSFVENPNIAVFYGGSKIYGNVPGGTIDPDPNPNPTPSPALQLQNFALYSLEQTIVSDRANFTGGGAVGSNGYVEIGCNSVITGHVNSGSNIQLKSGARINGNVLANGTVTLGSSVVITGEKKEGQSLAMLTIPTKTVNVNSTNKDVARNTTMTLNPGTYGDVIIRQDATLILKKGNYSFNKLIVEWAGHIVYDMQVNDKLNIDVKTDLEFYDRATSLFATGSGYAPAVNFYTNDVSAMGVGYDARITGIISAPYATVTIRSRALCDGAVYAKKINVEIDGRMSSDMTNPNGDYDGDFVPNALEIRTGTDPRDKNSFKDVAIPYPVIVDRFIDNQVVYDLRLFPEYHNHSDPSNSEKLIIEFPANSIIDPYGFVPIIIIGNKPGPVNGGPSYSDPVLPPGATISGRSFNIESGMIDTAGMFTMLIPVGSNSSIGHNVSSVCMYSNTNGTITQSNIDGTVITRDDGSTYLKVSCKGNAESGTPVISKTSAVAYFDDGVVFSNENNVTSLINFDIDLWNAGAGYTGEVLLYMTDSDKPSLPVPFVGTMANYGGDLVLRDYPHKSLGQLTISKIVIKVTNASGIITLFEQTGTYKVDPGKQLLIKYTKPFSLLKPGTINDISLIPSFNMSFECDDMDGEGRVVPNSTGTFSYDYYLKSHLGSTMAVVNADGPTPTVKEATWYHPYGTMVPLAEQTIPVRTKFTGKELDESDPQYAEVNFDITVTDFDGGSLPYGMLYVNYRDASDPASVRFQKGYLFSYDETNQVYTLKTSDKFPKSVNIEFLQINLRQADGTYKRNRVVPSPFYSLTLNSSSTLHFNVTKTVYDASSTTNLYAPVNPITIVYGNKGSELFYFGARYYDAELGVWGSTDAAEQFWSGYGYPANPVYIVDPDGNFALAACIVAAIFGAAVGTVRGAIDAHNEGGGFWNYVGEIFVHSNIAGAAGFGGAAVGGFAGGGFLGGLAGGAAGGGSSALGDAVVNSQNGAQIWDATWKGSVAGGAGGAVGGVVGNGVWGAMAGGFVGGATGSYLYGARGEDVLYAGLIGAGVSAAAYGIQSGVRYSTKTGDTDFDNLRNRIAMSRESEKSFRFLKPFVRERGGWLRADNKPDIWEPGTRRSVTPSPQPVDAVSDFHTHPNEGGPHSLGNGVHGPDKMPWKTWVLGRHSSWYHPGGGNAVPSQYWGATNVYLTAYTYNLYFMGGY